MERSLRAARIATFGFFTLNGFVMGMWVVHIPTVEHRAGISHAVLGWLLLLLGGGAFAGMQLVGPLTDRLGARKVVPASAALCSAALILPGLATEAWTLAVALLVFGFGNGCLDVSMNTHAVQVERGYERPVMSAFHAFFSVGGVLAALVGARTLSWDWSAALTLASVSVFGLAVTVLFTPALLRPESAGAPEATTDEAGAGRQPSPVDQPAPRGKTPSRIWALAALAFMLMLCEGVANDWSVLGLREVLDAPAATAALAYGAFSTAMTIGRLLTDRVAARFGPVAIVRYGTSLAALGLTAVALSPGFPSPWSAGRSSVSGCPAPYRSSSAPRATRTRGAPERMSPASPVSAIWACSPGPRSLDP